MGGSAVIYTGGGGALSKGWPLLSQHKGAKCHADISQHQGATRTVNKAAAAHRDASFAVHPSERTFSVEPTYTLTLMTLLITYIMYRQTNHTYLNTRAIMSHPCIAWKFTFSLINSRFLSLQNRRAMVSRRREINNLSP